MMSECWLTRIRETKPNALFDDQPNWPVVRTAGDSAMRFETTTFSTLSPSVSFITLVRSSNCLDSSSRCFFSSSVSSSSIPSLEMHTSFLPSYSLSCWIAYSSIGSAMRRTSKFSARNQQRSAAIP
jgi:hypothetical protein